MIYDVNKPESTADCLLRLTQLLCNTSKAAHRDRVT